MRGEVTAHEEQFPRVNCEPHSAGSVSEVCNKRLLIRARLADFADSEKALSCKRLSSHSLLRVSSLALSLQSRTGGLLSLLSPDLYVLTITRTVSTVNTPNSQN